MPSSVTRTSRQTNKAGSAGYVRLGTPGGPLSADWRTSAEPVAKMHHVEQVGLIVLGSIVGALATGGVTAFGVRSRRKRETQVAARLIYGDLLVMEGLCETILETGHWPDRLDTSEIARGMTVTWHEQRAAFVGGVPAWEWALVDGVYSTLVRTIPEHEPGQTCTDSDIASLKALQERIPRARHLVLERASSEKERNQLIAQLKKDAPADDAS